MSEAPTGNEARLLYEPARHEPLRSLPWNEREVRAAIEAIVADTEIHFDRDAYWPLHPLDWDDGEPKRFATPLYHGACGVIWALQYLGAIGAVVLSRSYGDELEQLLARNRAWLDALGRDERASFLMGDTPIRLMQFGESPSEEVERALVTLISGNIEHPARELMLGAPGTLLAALFMHERTGAARWSELFRATAATLWSQLEWSTQYRCWHWTQDMGGRRSTYLDAVHGFVATALPLIRGRHLLTAEDSAAWQSRIEETVRHTADRIGPYANWRPQLDEKADRKRLVQFCHGAPGFVISLAALPGSTLDDLLLAAGETTWSAGPLTKGSNLCHGTGGNGYAFLKLYQRTRDSMWLERARAFAMHGIVQLRDDAARYGRLRYSLWTGDLGFAIYLWDCVRAEAQFPTLDVFHAGPRRTGA